MEESKRRDLEERTFYFARDVRKFLRRIPRTVCNWKDGRQLVRSSGSVAANYVEAREAISRKDFLLRVKICRKEAKESRLWLRLIEAEIPAETKAEKQRLIAESTELMLIFSSIVSKCRL